MLAGKVTALSFFLGTFFCFFSICHHLTFRLRAVVSRGTFRVGRGLRLWATSVCLSQAIEPKSLSKSPRLLCPWNTGYASRTCTAAIFRQLADERFSLRSRLGFLARTNGRFGLLFDFLAFSCLKILLAANDLKLRPL